MAGTMMIEAETEKQMEQLVAQEEGVLSQEEGLEILESPPPVSRGFSTEGHDGYARAGRSRRRDVPQHHAATAEGEPRQVLLQ